MDTATNLATSATTPSTPTIRYHLIEVNPAAIGPLPEGLRQRPAAAKKLTLKDGTQESSHHFQTEKTEEMAVFFAREYARAKNQFGVEKMEDGRWVKAAAWIQIQRVEYQGKTPVRFHEGVTVEP